MLAIRCNDCNMEVARTTQNLQHLFAIAESIARFSLAMKIHQHVIHNDIECEFGLDIIEEV